MFQWMPMPWADETHANLVTKDRGPLKVVVCLWGPSQLGSRWKWYAALDGADIESREPFNSMAEARADAERFFAWLVP